VDRAATLGGEPDTEKTDLFLDVRVPPTIAMSEAAGHPSGFFDLRKSIRTGASNSKLTFPSWRPH